MKKPIRFGLALVPWARECSPHGHAGKPIPEGWVLPGGLRTIDEREAMEVAMLIDELIVASLKEGRSGPAEAANG